MTGRFEVSKSTAGKFEVHEDRAGKFRWRLKSRIGEVLATSQAYASKAGAFKGTQAVKTAADGATVVDQTQ